MPSPSPAASTSNAASHHDPSLEALLPERIGDEAIIRMSAPGAMFDYGGDICTLVCPREAREMADAVDADLDDVSIALAYDEGVDRYALVAWRIAGVSGTKLRDVRIGLIPSDGPFPIAEEHVVGDETVTVLIPSIFAGFVQILVPRDDALIIIVAPLDLDGGLDTGVPPEAVEVIEALP